jgi:hypothetical protein
MAMPSWAAKKPDAIAIQLLAPLNDDKCNLHAVDGSRSPPSCSVARRSGPHGDRTAGKIIPLRSKTGVVLGRSDLLRIVGGGGVVMAARANAPKTRISVWVSHESWY